MSAPQSCNPDQLFLLPPSLYDWLPEEHLVHVLSEVIDQVDLSPLAPDGQPAFTSPDPRVMVKLLFYAYVSGIPSSRGIAQRCLEDVGFRVLTWNAAPEFRSVGAFRRQHRPALQAMFLQIIRCCRQLGLKHLGDIPLNGTNGNAKASGRRSGRSSRSESAYAHFVADIEAFFAQADEADAAEDRRFGPVIHRDSLPAALTSLDSRQAAIREALACLNAEGPTPKPDSPAVRAKSKKRTSSAPKPLPKLVMREQPGTEQPVTVAPETAGEPEADIKKPAEEAKASGVAIPLSKIAHLLEGPLDPTEAEGLVVLTEKESETAPEPPAVEPDPQEEALSGPENGTPIQEVANGPSKPFILSYVTGGLHVDASAVQGEAIVPTPSDNRRRNIRVRMPEQSPAKLQLQDAELIDLSISGALVEHVGSVRPGQLYQLSFALDGQQVHTQARAVRGQANRLAPPENGERRIVYRTALEFVRIDNGGSELIAAHIERMLAGLAVSV
jgi:transposase